MERTAVLSSNLAEVGYDGEKKVLEVKFKNGRVYQYSGVRRSVFAQLMQAGSKGGFFHENVVKKFDGKEVNDG